MLLFTILRRTAGNYGRLAVIRKEDDESRWTQLFFQTEQSEDGEPTEEGDSLERGRAFFVGRSLVCVYVGRYGRVL